MKIRPSKSFVVALIYSGWLQGVKATSDELVVRAWNIKYPEKPLTPEEYNLLVDEVREFVRRRNHRRNDPLDQPCGVVLHVQQLRKMFSGTITLEPETWPMAMPMGGLKA